MNSDLKLIAEEYEKVSKLGGMESTPQQAINTDILLLASKVVRELQKGQPDINKQAVTDKIYSDIRAVVVKYINGI